MQIKMFGRNRVVDLDAKQAIHWWTLHHNSRPNFLVARKGRAMHDTQAVKEALEAAVDGQADDAVVSSVSATGIAESDYQSGI